MGGISIGVTAHPGGGQLGDSDGGGVAPKHTVITSLQSLLFFAVLQNFYTTKNPECLQICAVKSDNTHMRIHSETLLQH